MPPETLYGYLEGDDPLTGRRVIDEIIDALTKAPERRLTRPAPSPLPPRRPPPARSCSAPDTEDNLQRLFYERGWTDGLPVILPTEERVEHMLTGTGRPRDELVGEIFLHDTKETAQVHGLRHRRGGGHGRGAAGAPPGDPGRRGDQACRPSRPRPRPSAACSWSTGPSATRSA